MMRQPIKLLYFLLLLILTSSCHKNKLYGLSKEELDWIEDCKSNYYKKEGNPAIVRHENVDGDLIVDISYDTDADDIAAKLRMFNYGGDICLFRGLKEDYFINNFGYYKIICLINNDDIIIEEVTNDKSYGEWAFAKVRVGNKIIDDVFITPYAYDDYKVHKTTLVYIEFRSGTLSLKVVFKPSLEASDIISERPEKVCQADFIIMNADASFVNGPGQFWKKW